MARRMTIDNPLRSPAAASVGGVEIPVPSAGNPDALALHVDALRDGVC